MLQIQAFKHKLEFFKNLYLPSEVDNFPTLQNFSDGICDDINKWTFGDVV